MDQLLTKLRTNLSATIWTNLSTKISSKPSIKILGTTSIKTWKKDTELHRIKRYVVFPSNWLCEDTSWSASGIEGIHCRKYQSIEQPRGSGDVQGRSELSEKSVAGLGITRLLTRRHRNEGARARKLLAAFRSIPRGLWTRLRNEKLVALLPKLLSPGALPSCRAGRRWACRGRLLTSSIRTGEDSSRILSMGNGTSGSTPPRWKL